MSRYKTIVGLLFLIQMLSGFIRAEVFPPDPVAIAASSDGSFLVRFDSKMKVFSVSADEKYYHLISEFDSLWAGSVQKLLISKHGDYIAAFETPTLPPVKGLDEVICLYSSKGERVRQWRLRDVLEKDDQAKIHPDSAGSIWWCHEVGIGGTPAEVFIAGPTEGPAKYVYALSLEKLIWKKVR